MNISTWDMDDEFVVELEYPDVKDNKIRKIRISLMDVRAADDIRISYDKDRDGWKIEQEVIESDGGYYRGTGEWKESALVPAWQFEQTIRPQN